MKRALILGGLLVFLHFHLSQDLHGQASEATGMSYKTEGPPMRSGGSYKTSRHSSVGVDIGSDPKERVPPALPSRGIGVAFDGFDFDDNSTETGFLFIPPDPIGAAGTDRVIAVVNVMMEARTKTGTLLWRDALKDFFSPLGGATLGTFTFDPKVVYDQYEGPLRRGYS